MDLLTVCDFVTDILIKNGIRIENEIGYSSGIRIYPKDYFCPKDYYTGQLEITGNTRSIHHYDATWVSPVQKRIDNIERKYISKFGKELGIKKSRKATIVLKVINKLQTTGIRKLQISLIEIVI